jgi:hypothetical protein
MNSLRDIAAWTHQENLVLRVDNTTHHLSNETVPREKYPINDNIVRLLLLMEPGDVILFSQPTPLDRSEAHIPR